MKVNYSRQSLLDLRGIADYIRIRNPQAASEVEAAIKSTVELLADFPLIGRNRHDLEARLLGVPSYPYTIYYRVEADDVWIVHIRDDRRRPVGPGDI